MKLTKTLINHIISNAPKGATHLKVTTAAGKFAISGLKQAASSLEGVDGDVVFGAIVGKGKDAKFTPTLDGKVDLAKASEDAAKPAAPKEKKAKAPKVPKDPTQTRTGRIEQRDASLVALMKAGKLDDKEQITKIAAAAKQPVKQVELRIHWIKYWQALFIRHGAMSK